LPTCEYKGCLKHFDAPGHPHQRFCSKSCAKKGTQNRHKGLLNGLAEGALERALSLVDEGHSYARASELTGVKRATIWIQRQQRIKKQERP
jgi:hypothetical protein